MLDKIVLYTNKGLYDEKYIDVANRIVYRYGLKGIAANGRYLNIYSQLTDRVPFSLNLNCWTNTDIIDVVCEKAIAYLDFYPECINSINYCPSFDGYLEPKVLKYELETLKEAIGEVPLNVVRHCGFVDDFAHIKSFAEICEQSGVKELILNQRNEELSDTLITIHQLARNETIAVSLKSKCPITELQTVKPPNITTYYTSIFKIMDFYRKRV